MHTKSYIVASDIDVYTKSYIVPNNGWGQEGNKLKDSKDQAYDRHTGPLPHRLFKKLKKNHYTMQFATAVGYLTSL